MASPNPLSRAPYQSPNAVSRASMSSAASSACQSSSSLPSLVLPTMNPSSRQAAPLPSPIAQQAPSFQYGSLHPSSHHPQQLLQHQHQHQQQHGPSSGSFDYRPDRSSAGRTAAETGQFLRDYNLVAEAAKRAQMAVLARDMESMEM